MFLTTIVQLQRQLLRAAHNSLITSQKGLKKVDMFMKRKRRGLI